MIKEADLRLTRSMIQLFLKAAAIFLILGDGYAQQYVISTVAGGVPPPTPALATSNSVYPPTGITSDSQGNVFFTSGNCIFKLDRGGILTRIAGNSRAGYSGDGGPAERAQLSNPNGLSFDPSGNLFVADSGNQRVRRISLNGMITTVAGNGNWKPFGPFGDGGPATSTGLGSPSSVAVDKRGNLYFSEQNGRVRKVAPSGIISTIAGGGSNSPGDGGPAIEARLRDSAGLTVDSTGQVFIADSASHRIHRVSVDGIITTIAGTGVAGFSGDTGRAALSQISAPRGIAVDSQNNLFVADSGNYRIRRISPDGTIETVAGGGATFPGNGVQATRASLCSIVSNVTVDGEGNLYLAACWVQRVAPDGIISIVSGNGSYSLGGDGGPASSAQLWQPADVAIDGNGSLFIADTANNLIRRVAADGIITTVAGISSRGDNYGFSGDGGLATNALLALPSSVAVDSDGNLFIADTQNSRIRKVSGAGIISTIAGNGSRSYSGDGGPATRASINYPLGICLDHLGNLFISDYQNHRIRKISADGIITTVAGNGVQGFSGDGGPATRAQLFIPRAVAVDADGNLFISDTGNARVRKVSADGTISTVVGSGAVGFSGDGGPATSATLFGTNGLAVDGNGNLFLADSIPTRIRRISRTGIITTIAGGGGFNFSTDGWPAIGATLSIVQGVRVGTAGQIYLAESSGSVRLLEPTSHSVLIGSVVDAASQRATSVSPGMIIAIYGAGLGPGQIVQNRANDGLFSTQAAGTAVFVNGVPAPVLYTSDTQVAAIVPYAVNCSTAHVTVRYQGETSPPYEVRCAVASPGIFSLNGTGAGQAAAVNADGTINDSANPVKVGGLLSLYATGVGQTAPAGIDGKVAAVGQAFPEPLIPVKVTVDGQPAAVIYAGAAPEQVAGLLQIVIQIPPAVRPSGYVPAVLETGDASTVPEQVWIAVSGG